MCGWSYQGRESTATFCYLVGTCSKVVARGSRLEAGAAVAASWNGRGAGYVPLNWLFGCLDASRVCLVSFFSPKLPA